MEWKNSKNKVTIVLVGINIAVFIGLSLFGMTEDTGFMLDHGALYVPYILEQQEYYRIFTSIFLHFGIEHLGNNMLLLFVIGTVLEEEMGSIKYILLYIGAGLAGNGLSILWEITGQSFYVSAGASGAIFGVIGGMLWVVVRNKGQVGNLTSNRLLFMIGLSLYVGFTGTGINNLAHLGGLIAGFILGIILYRKSNKKRRPFIENRF